MLGLNEMLIYLSLMLIAFGLSLSVILKQYRLLAAFLLALVVSSVMIVVNRRAVVDPPAPTALTTSFYKNRFISAVGAHATKDYGQNHVLPSVTIAQAILESNWGDSALSRDYNNYFGIKTQSTDKKHFVKLRTREVINGKDVTMMAKFATYNSLADSIHAHGTLLKQGTTDKPDRYRAVLSATSYKQATKALVKAGYATDPAYSRLLDRIIAKYNLVEYDKQVIAK